MKVPCSVIQDLLPLYHDSVCSPESSAMIEEHLKDCEACQEEFHKLEESPLAENGKKEEAEKENVQRMKNVKRSCTKSGSVFPSSRRWWFCCSASPAGLS